jgi:TRAP-type mannitol/chloroaromatic compound transport system permease small subunit
MSRSRNFGNLMKWIFALILKYNFILMTCYGIMQMYKKIRCQENIVSKVQTQLNLIKFPRLDEFSEFV